MKELSQAIVTRAEARAQGLTRYFTGKPCKHGHVSERMRSSGACVECQRLLVQKARAANPEKFRARSAAWSEANYLRKQIVAAEWIRNNPGDHAQRMGKYRVRKAGTSVELTPQQQHQVNQIYLLMTKLNLATGIKYEVDHYIPVTKGGSHAPENLWVIPAEQNLSKGSNLPCGNS